MLLACEIPELELQWFRERRILVKEVKPFSDTALGDKTLCYPATVTCKLGLFSEQFKDWNVVVFIDADCIVRYPLDLLAKTKGFTAARDWLRFAIMRCQTTRPEGMGESEYFQQFKGYSLTATTFNTGVFAFNTQIIDNATQATLRRILHKYGHLARFPEQLWMNLYFWKKWEMLPMEYNLYASFLHTGRGLPKKHVDGVVLHFPRDPNDECIRCWNPKNAFYDEWKRNLERAEMIDLEHIPKPDHKWPSLRRFLFWRWRLQIALHRDYLAFWRNKMALRSRMRRLISTLKANFA